jgi:hypothetical protein
MTDQEDGVENAPTTIEEIGTKLEPTLDEYFGEIPVWGNTNEAPTFAVVPYLVNGKMPSGRLPALRLHSWRDLPNLLEHQFFSHPDTDWVFRGHRRFDWNLSPTLGRLNDDGIVRGELAATQLEKFKKAVRGRLHDNSLLDDDIELWAVGQHHGLQTPLLDWTLSPYVALFFAFVEADSLHEYDNPYRVLYALNKGVIGDDGRFPDLKVIEPKKDDHGRLVNQAGLFVFAPYEETIENSIIDYLAEEEGENIDLDDANALARYICKIYVPNEEVSEGMKHLRHMNVHHASLFPDLIGASQFCNSHVSEAAFRLDLKEAATDLEKLKKLDISKIPEVRDLPEDEEKKDEPAQRAYAVEAPTEEDAIESVLPGDYSSQGEAERFENLLSILAAAQGVDPTTQVLIAKKLDRELRNHMVVDWQTRDSVKAKLRNAIRHTFRKFNYPENVRDQVIEAIVGGPDEGEE